MVQRLSAPAACLLSSCLTTWPQETCTSPRFSFSELLEPAVPPFPVPASREASTGRDGGYLEVQDPGTSHPRSVSHRTWPHGIPIQVQGPFPGSRSESGWDGGEGLLGEGGGGFVQGGSAVGSIDQLALRGHDEGESHAGLAGALAARVRHRHGVHTSSCGFGKKRVVGHSKWRWWGDRSAAGPDGGTV